MTHRGVRRRSILAMGTALTAVAASACTTQNLAGRKDAVPGPRSCDVVVIGGGLAGLRAARALAGRGVDVLVLEAQGRVGGRTLTVTRTDGSFIDHGGQYMSPGQDRITALADELGVKLFPSWGGGRTVRWSGGARTTFDGMLPPGDPDAEPAARQAAATLTAMAATVALDAPWTAPEAAAWDAQTLHGWLAANVGAAGARTALSQAIEGVFTGGTSQTSLLAALFWIRSGDPLVPFTATADPGPDAGSTAAPSSCRTVWPRISATGWCSARWCPWSSTVPPACG